jgi:hypothetical protein
MWNRHIALVRGFILTFLSTAIAQEGILRINVPAQDERVPERPYVEGTVPDPRTTVWVVVHPMETSNYWVQPAVSVKEDRTWKVKIYVGRPGSVDSGSRFEIRAVANPRGRLSEGQVLDAWPDAQSESQVVGVTRG